LSLCVFLTEFLVDTVVADFHLVWLVSHRSWLKAIIHGLLDANVDIVVLIVFSYSIEMNGVAVNVDGILAVPEDHDIVVEILRVEGIFVEEIAQFMFIYEKGLLEEGYSVVVLFEGVVLEDLVLEVKEEALVDGEDSKVREIITHQWF
jgi:hypothetical protein